MGKGGERNLEFMRLIVLTLRYLDRTAREFNGESVIYISFFFSSSRLRITRISFHCLNWKLRV